MCRAKLHSKPVGITVLLAGTIPVPDTEFIQVPFFYLVQCNFIKVAVMHPLHSVSLSV